MEFKEGTTAAKLNVEGIPEGSKILELINHLNCTTSGDCKQPENAMEYNVLCYHDTGFLCEHRLQYIVDFIKVNFKER